LASSVVLTTAVGDGELPTERTSDATICSMHAVKTLVITVSCDARRDDGVAVSGRH